MTARLSRPSRPNRVRRRLRAPLLRDYPVWETHAGEEGGGLTRTGNDDGQETVQAKAGHGFCPVSC